MRNWKLPLVLVLPAAAWSGQAGAGAGTELIAIYTQFAQPPSSLSVEHMKGELAEIMAPLHLHFTWRGLEQANGREALSEIVVVNFHGTCRGDGLVPPRSPDGALGWTHITDGQVLPFSEVNCDRIRELIGGALAAAAPADRARLLGRAMARVLAHELYHFFTNTTKHSPSGIAKARYTGAELAAGQLRFGEGQLEKVRSGRMRNLLGEVHRAAEPAGSGR